MKGITVNHLFLLKNCILKYNFHILHYNFAGDSVYRGVIPKNNIYKKSGEV